MNRFEQEAGIKFSTTTFKHVGQLVINGPKDKIEAPIPKKGLKEVKVGSSFPYTVKVADDGESANWIFNTYAIGNMTNPESKERSVRHANKYIAGLVKDGYQKTVTDGSNLRIVQYNADPDPDTTMRFEAEVKRPSTDIKLEQAATISESILSFEQRISPGMDDTTEVYPDTEVTVDLSLGLRISFGSGARLSGAGPFDGGFDLVGSNLQNEIEPLVCLYGVALWTKLAGK